MRFAAIKKALKIKDSLLCCEKGATALEYAFIIALIFLAIMAAIGQVANETISMWDKIAAAHNQI
ncbi:MAG: Flp family type IVb pilin [Sphingobium sp.]|nr:Flp family type IVb pilin [Sphingobium sp.]